MHEPSAAVMPRESLSLVEAAYAALADRGLEAFADYWADDIEWLAIGGRFRGVDAGRTYLQEWFSRFDDLTAEALELSTSPPSSNSATARSPAPWSSRRSHRPWKLPRQGTRPFRRPGMPSPYEQNSLS
jgi:hypothetical protein